MDPDALRAAVAANIKARAERQGLSLNALARKADVGRTHLFAIVWGQRSATTDTLSKLAAALDCDAWQLLKPSRRDDSEAEEMRVGFMDLLAALEMRKIRARNKARVEACRAAGRTHGGPLPFGYRRRIGGRTGRSGAVVELEPDLAEQAVLRRIGELADASRSLREIARILANDGMTTRTGRPWQPSVLARIVSRARGAGGA